MPAFTSILIRQRVISKEQLAHAEEVARDQAISVGDALVSLGYATGEQVMRAVAEEHNLEYIDLSETPISPSVVELVPESVARENTILPLDELDDDVLRVIVSDPLDLETFDKLRFILNRQIEIALAPRESILEAINRYYGQIEGESADSKPGFITSAYLADGSFADYWLIASGATAEPATVESVEAGRTQVRLVQRYPPDVNHINWPKIVRALAERGGFDIEEIDMAIFTQVNLPSIKLVMEELGLPLSKTHWIMEDWGYMGSACIPVCLDDAIERGKVHPGDLVVLVGSGVGYNYAGAALRMP